MSIRSVVILTLFLSFFTHKIFSLDMVEASFLINDKSGYAVENATIKIGDLTLKTSKDGVAKIILFPAVYDLTIEKSNFIYFIIFIIFCIIEYSTFKINIFCF